MNACIAGTCATGIILAGPAVMGYAIGVSSSGPVAGGLFACAQSTGMVTAGGIGAMAQSVAMAGATPKVAAAGGAVAAYVAALRSRM